MDMPKVFDQQGQEQDWDWLLATFGPVTLERAGALEGVSHAYRVVKVQEAAGPAVQVVNVVDQDGVPLDRIRVVRYWPDAPALPEWPLPASRWREQGVFGGTNVEGNIGFGMGQGDYYFAPNVGASAVWVADGAGPADVVSGLGMLGGTNHRHLDIYYQLIEIETPPPGEPPIRPPIEPPVEPPAEPPAEPPVTPPVEPPVTPPAEPPEEPLPELPATPPAEPPGEPSDEAWDKLLAKLDQIIELLEERLPGEE